MGEKPNFSGSYCLESSEHMEEFMLANGLNFMFRKIASLVKPDVEIIQEGDNKFIWKVVTTLYTNSTTFLIGEPVEEKQANGVVMMVTLTWDGDVLVSNYEPIEPGKGKKQYTTREINGDDLIITLYIDNVVAKRHYKRKKTD